MNTHHENPDRDVARVMKKESHENMRRDRKQFRNIANELRYAATLEGRGRIWIWTWTPFRDSESDEEI